MAERQRGLGSKPAGYRLEQPQLGIRGESFFGRLQIVKFFLRLEKTKEIREARLHGNNRPTSQENK